MTHVEQVRDGEVPAVLAATYVELRRCFGASEVPALLRALAPIPSALVCSWRALGPNVRTVAFERQSRVLHARCVRAMVELGTPLLEPVLRAEGLDVDGFDELREEVRRLESVETRAWLFAAGLVRWLEGEALGGRPGLTGSYEVPPLPMTTSAPGVRGVAAELTASLSKTLHLPESTPLMRRLATSEGVLAAVVDGLGNVLNHRGFGEEVTWAAHEARLAWDRMPLAVPPWDAPVEAADHARWRHVASLFEEAGVRHGLFAAALRVALDGAEDALETPGDDESLH